MSGPGFQSTPGVVALVTGSTGLCGARLVEMLLERGASTVICFDIAVPDETWKQRIRRAEANTKGKTIVCSGPDHGNITKLESVEKAFAKAPKIDIVYHIAALVGPFHDRDMYFDVNLQGTRHIIQACRKFHVPKLVNSSSPSTRFTGDDVQGLREDQMQIPKTFLALYAETKAYAEKEVTAACSDTFRTISVAPHQIYGPYDKLFMPNLLETAGNGRLRIFGKGDKLISVCYVDNYIHGLMCGADVLDDPKSPALGKYYVVTDGKPVNFWDLINGAAMQMGFADMHKKLHLPVPLLYFVAYICNLLGFMIGKKFKLNPFNVRMLTIHRYFSIENAQRDLLYQPVVDHDTAWQSTVDWFKANWLPAFWKANGLENTTKKQD